MKLADSTFWAIRQVKTRLLESLLIVLGIGLGIAVVCSVLGLNDTFQQVSAEFEQLYRHFSVSTVEDVYDLEQIKRALTVLGESGEKLEKLKLKDYFKFKEAEIEGTQYIWSSMLFWTTDYYYRSSEGVPENGQVARESNDKLAFCRTTADVFSMAKLEIISGDIFRDSDLLNQSRVAVLGKKMADKRFPDEDPVGKQIQINEETFTIIGVVETQLDVEKTPYTFGLGQTDNLDHLIYLPLAEGRLSEIHFLADQDANIADYYARLKDFARLNYKERLSVTGFFIHRQQGQNQAMNRTIAILAIIALLIAAINILNLMLARVWRRYKHIGISVAVGASKRNIFSLFIGEAIILGILGSIMGILLSFGATYLLEALIKQPVQLSLSNSLIGIGVAFVTSLLFGFYPASQAAKIDPVDALRVD